MSNRLEIIANRQRKTFVRDVLFAAFVLATAIALTSVATGDHIASVAQR